MRKDLLGYLLGALSDEERDRLEEAIRKDPELQRQLEALKDQLDPIDADIEDYEPPKNLADRTCDLIEDVEEFGVDILPNGFLPASGATFWQNDRPRELAAGRRTWSFADMVVAAGIFLAASMLFFPAIANSRFQSQITKCQHNLMQIGQGLTSYSDKMAGCFPEIPTSGNRAVAGIYAPTLREMGYVTQDKIFVCPSSRLAECLDEWNVPTYEQIDTAEGGDLRCIQRTMGGSYGYSLGYLRNGRYTMPINDGRAHFALMSDMPSLHLAGHQSNNHGGLGQNVLFEDNRIEFIPTHRSRLNRDVIFLNRRGFTAPGLDRNDAVIGHSFTSPFSIFDPLSIEG